MFLMLAASWCAALLSALIGAIVNLATGRPLANGWRMAMVWLALGLGSVLLSALQWQDRVLAASVLREVALPFVVVVTALMLVSERFERRRRPLLPARRHSTASSSRRHT